MAGTRSATPRWSRAKAGVASTGRVRDSLPQSGAELADVIAKISHDIRTPLNAVIGFADLMQRELHGALGNERYKEYANHIRDSGIDLLRAAEETLLLTVLLGSPQSIVREPSCLATLIGEVAEQLQAGSGPETGDIECDVGDAMSVVIDKRAMRLALRHLLRCSQAVVPAHTILRITGTDDHGVVRLDIVTELPAGDLTTASVSAHKPVSLDADIVLARSILRMQGAELIEGDPETPILFTVLMESAAQPDFFSAY